MLVKKDVYKDQNSITVFVSSPVRLDDFVREWLFFSFVEAGVRIWYSLVAVKYQNAITDSQPPLFKPTVKT